MKKQIKPKESKNKGKKYEKPLSLYSIGMKKVLNIVLKKNKA